jgi:hypothetical protein
VNHSRSTPRNGEEDDEEDGEQAPPASAPVDHTLETERAIRAHEQHLAGKVLHGAAAIATFLGRPLRETIYNLELGRISAFKMGATWCSTTDRLIRQYQTERYVPPASAEPGPGPETANTAGNPTVPRRRPSPPAADERTAPPIPKRALQTQHAQRRQAEAGGHRRRGART